MERRVAKRYPRRLRVALIELGSGSRVEGFTGNISTSGVFVACGRMIDIGERVRVELGTDEPPLVIYGVIARQSRVPPALRSVQREGMGIRFLRVSELVRELLPDQAQDEEGNQGAESASPGRVSSAEKPAVPAKTASPKPKVATREAATEPAQPRKSVPKKPVRPDPPGVYRVTVEDREELRRRYEEEIRFGGMSVKAKRAPDLGEHVTVLLDLASTESEPLAVKAEVVLVHGDGGFGVQFSDASRFLFAVKRLL